MTAEGTPKPPPGEWAIDAACAGMDPDYFLPDDRSPFPQAARDACARCEVRVECLEYALMPPWEQRGLWGGTGPRERREIMRRRRKGAA